VHPLVDHASAVHPFCARSVNEFPAKRLHGANRYFVLARPIYRAIFPFKRPRTIELPIHRRFYLQHAMYIPDAPSGRHPSPPRTLIVPSETREWCARCIRARQIARPRIQEKPGADLCTRGACAGSRGRSGKGRTGLKTVLAVGSRCRRNRGVTVATFIIILGGRHTFLLAGQVPLCRFPPPSSSSFLPFVFLPLPPSYRTLNPADPLSRILRRAK